MWLLSPAYRSALGVGVLNLDFHSSCHCVWQVPLSGTPSPRPCSWRGWKARPWSRRLFGAATSPGWTPPPLSASTSSRQGFPASRGAPPGAAGASPTSGGYGPPSPASSVTASPGSSFSKTSPAFSPAPPTPSSASTAGSTTTPARSASSGGPVVAQLAGAIFTDAQGGLFSEPGSEPFSGTWPRSGSMRSGRVYRRPTWAPPTSASGSSSWPTATVSDSHGHTWSNGWTGKTLAGESQRWPTPCAQEDQKSPAAHLAMKARMKGGRRSTDTSLNVATKLWQTPSVADTTGGHATRGGARSGEALLNGQAASWPTQRARDEKGAGHVDSLGSVAQSMPMPELPPENGAARRHVSPLWPTATAAAGQRGSDPKRNRGPGPSLNGIAQTFPSGRPDPTTLTDGDNCSQSVPTSRRLSPAFVEALMGMPPGWTQIGSTGSGASEMRSSLNRWRRASSSLLAALGFGEQA